ncbi:unnamed protein product [Symbiodinium sp. CCMP2592]|nr:unnamed protein product [Symbiodinium sp. CCMP2592]
MWGVVMVAAGWEHVALAWASLRTLRSLGCQWPIQLWHLGKESITREVEMLFRSELDVEPIDVHRARREDPLLSEPSLMSFVPADREDAGVHCLKGDPVAYSLPPVAVHLSNFSQVLLMFPDWVAFEDVCTESIWMRKDGSAASAFFHAGSSRVQDLSYYPKAWLSFGLSAPADEWEVDESALFLDKSQCPKGALVVLEMLLRNAQRSTPLFPCGTVAFWRPAWELAGCRWSFSRYPPALLGFKTVDHKSFLGGGRGARDTDDGHVLGVHFQWFKYYWLQRPSPFVPMVANVAALSLEPLWDPESLKLAVVGYANSANFHFAQYENYSQCSLFELEEVASESFPKWTEIWKDAWREAFSEITSCPEHDARCWWNEVCLPEPCTLLGAGANTEPGTSLT